MRTLKQRSTELFLVRIRACMASTFTEGDLGDNCKNALGHFNPAGVNHGAPGDEVRHIGDLGNIDVDDEGIADIKIEDHKVKMSGTDSVIGKAIVIHADMDDLG